MRVESKERERDMFCIVPNFRSAEFLYILRIDLQPRKFCAQKFSYNYALGVAFMASAKNIDSMKF